MTQYRRLALCRQTDILARIKLKDSVTLSLGIVQWHWVTKKKRRMGKCLYTSLKSPEYATTINPAPLPVCSKSLKVCASEFASNWTTSQSNICFVSQRRSRQILPDSSDLFRPPPGPDWLIGSARKIPVGPFWFFRATGATVQSWNWVDIYHGSCPWAACARIPLAWGVQPGWWCNYIPTPADGVAQLLA